MIARPLPDQADRDLIRHGLDDTIVVEAAAGTGKTTELVQRILQVLSSGRARIEQIVAVTFTEKAAGELKLRIRQELETWRRNSDGVTVQARLTDAIQRLEEAHVSTIHGFCADLLRERPVEACIDPLFEVLTEQKAARCFNEAFDSWLNVALEQRPEGFRRALRRTVWSPDGRINDDGPTDRLRRAAWNLAEWRDFTAAWRRDPFDRDSRLKAVLDAVMRFERMTATPTSLRDPLFADTAPIRDLARDLASAKKFDAMDFDAWEARVADLAQHRDLRRARKGRDRMFGAGIEREAVWSALQALLAEFEAFQVAADADLAALLRVELSAVIDGYEHLKQRMGALDFVDLLLRTRDLLVGHVAVRRSFQDRFAYLFIDEFQDTDPLQAEILLLLAADDPSVSNWREIRPRPGKLFIVGDPKQAIYRFRRADVETYREVRDLLVSRGARRAYLHTSFRSRPAIQRLVNAAFAPVMTDNPETLQADYVALSPFRSDAAQPAVIALPVPKPYGKRHVAGYAIDQSSPDGIGAFVSWLLKESGWMVTEKTDAAELSIDVPVQPRHVCILFRRFLQFGNDVTRPYVEALEARGVPHLLVGGKSFHGREEVETVRAALAAIEWPDDELSVFATLRGALFAIDDETLFAYRDRHSRLHPFGALSDPAADVKPVIDALSMLARLHRRRNNRPVADTITELLNETRAHVGFVLRPAGEQALANVLHVAELARQYEASGGMSFRGFVDQLREQADGGESAEAPILEEGSEGVRLMTVHKSKGLEFPVVILADMTAKLRSERADRLIDKTRRACYLRLGRWTPVELAANEAFEVARDEAEGVRIAYVAATRARDLLVVPVVGDAQWDGGWTSPLNAAVYPELSRRRSAEPAPLCPPFRKDSVYERPDQEAFTSATVQPGLHRFGRGETAYDVVWWDPHALELGLETSLGLRRETLITKDVSTSTVDEGLREYERWKAERAQRLKAGSRPSLAVRSATEWAAGAQASFAWRAPRQRNAVPVQAGLFEEPPTRPANLEVPTVDVLDLREKNRPSGGARFGDLVHAMLAVVPLDATRDDVAAVARLQARILGASDLETQEAVDIVVRVLAHDLFRRASEASKQGGARRESPVTITAPDGTLIEGIVDLAFVEAGRWVLVDFKTDRELSQEREARYTRQVSLYAAAMEASTGLPVSAMMIRV
jgi:ATP-dependent exoDNAse (exonuclease V) beta subunit